MGEVKETVKGRLMRLTKTAKAYNLTMTQPTRGTFVFEKLGGQKATVYGMWASEQFIRGYTFAYQTGEFDGEDKTGTWRDNDDGT